MVAQAPPPILPHLDVLLARLQERYGPVIIEPTNDILGELVETILSQHTSDHNADLAYQKLRQRFPTWEEVCRAHIAEIAEAIRSAGLSRHKAPIIRAVICTMLQEGQERLAWLATAPLAEAQAWLETLPGVGPKTAACVLLFGLGRPALPVDTHVYRVAQRLGLLPPRCTSERAHQLLAALVPPEYRAAFHVLLIRHGRQCCHARNPRCPTCPILDYCPTGLVRVGQQSSDGKETQHARDDRVSRPSRSNTKQQPRVTQRTQ
ncbi:MAG: endonuclease III [Thermorudis peleae]|nr:endonuclease III [Thermorudis peleae]